MGWTEGTNTLSCFPAAGLLGKPRETLLFSNWDLSACATVLSELERSWAFDPLTHAEPCVLLGWSRNHKPAVAEAAMG